MTQPGSQEWSRAELILTLDLYMRSKGHIPDVRDPGVAALSSLLSEQAILEHQDDARTGRSKSAIIFKMSNFRALDPDAKSEGKKGFPHVGSLDRKIWREFAGRTRALNEEAELIRQRIESARTEVETLRANLHILRLLGDELIGSPRLAIFELVKNAYDADAEKVIVRLDLDSKSPSISIKDNGCGMSLDTIRNGWLQIGTPSKRQPDNVRTPRFGRLFLGAKGIGRLAAFKMGDRLEMITREQGGTEYRLVMDLDSILERSNGRDSSIEDVRVRVTSSDKPSAFTGNEHGTVIRVSKLRSDLNWQKRELHELHRLITSIASPFKAIGEFETILEMPGREIGTLPDIKQVLEKALWVYEFKLDEHGRFQWTFSFNPPAVFRALKSRNVKSGPSGKLEKLPENMESDRPSRPPRDGLFYEAKDLEGIGPISGRFYVFDLRPTILRQLGSKLIKTILSTQGGVRVYRDGIRVFNYGEPGDDWLELNISRVNKPGRKLATNSVVAAIDISLAKSKGLREKTNREGFDENEVFTRFKDIVNAIVEHLNLARRQDRDEIERVLKGEALKEDAPVRFRKAVDEVASIAKLKGFNTQIQKPLDQIVKEYETLREVVASSGAGLNLAIVFHEVEREVRALAEDLEKGEKPETLKVRAENLTGIMDGFSGLIKKASRKTMKISLLVDRVLQLNKTRFEAHKIDCTSLIIDGGDKDFEASGAFNFYFQTLMNLIDNSIYWVRKRRELQGKHFKAMIQIRSLPDWTKEGPCIAVLDNGPGFSIAPEDAMRPFASTRPGGMGLGLYFARIAMEANGGDLLIPNSIEDLELETPLDGAAVVMRFRRSN